MIKTGIAAKALHLKFNTNSSYNTRIHLKFNVQFSVVSYLGIINEFLIKKNKSADLL